MNDISQSDLSNTRIEKFRKDYEAPDYLVESITLTFRLFTDKTIVSSKLSVVANQQKSDDHHKNSKLQLNGENLKLLEIKLDGVSLPRKSYHLNDEEMILADMPDQFILEIETEIDPVNNTSLEGLYKSSGKYCTQCEAEGFRKITYYPDRPDNLAVFTTRIEADKQQFPYLLSNGNLIDSGELENDRHFAVWHDPFPKPCYLFALVAGDFDLLEDTYITASDREVALKIYVEKGKLNQCQHAMISLKKSMDWDQDVYGLEYDLDIYMIVAVSDFNMGAMENKGLNVFNTAYVLANNKTATDADFENVERVIAHEYFHNWTGNRVTCRDWFQLSLKEGLTVYRDQEFSSDMNSRAVQRLEDAQAIKVHQFAEDAGPMAHPIRPDSYIEMNNFYTLTVYNKGAEVIRMIHTLLGEGGFQSGMNLYFQRHDGQAATCEDFIKAMEDATETDLVQFRNWYHQAGTPLLDVSGSWQSDEGIYSLKFNQSCNATPGQKYKEPFLIPLRLALLDDSGNMQDIIIDSEQQQFNYLNIGSGKEIVLQITEKEQTISFRGLTEEPIPSLLRGFSAPIKLNFDYSPEQLALLLTHDDDSYSSWDAGQNLMQNIIMDMTQSLCNDSEPVVPDMLLTALVNILQRNDKDPSLLAMSIRVPDINFLIEQYQQVPFDELITAHKTLKSYLAVELKNELLFAYNKAASNIKLDSKNAVGWRRLQNACLWLLSESNDEECQELAYHQFDAATDMTNSLAALTAIAHSESTEKQKYLALFYKRWQDEELVLDKWFSVQATDPSDTAINNIEQLLQHADFQLTNPNKVRALFASFAKGNLENFHRKDGKGYQLVADIIIKLNKVNPQIAARLTMVFNRWRNFDASRKQFMEAELTRIVEQNNISPDVYEIASKALL